MICSAPICRRCRTHGLHARPFLRREALGPMGHSKMFHGMPANHLQGSQEFGSWKSLWSPLDCKKMPKRP